MNIKQALDKLESLGTAKTRKTYARHGVGGAMFGVKYGDLYKLVKEIKVDQDLAVGLWASGNHDARVLATMVADPEQMTTKLLTSWVGEIDNHVICYGLAGVVAKSAAGRKLMWKWMQSKAEWSSATGWMCLSVVLSGSDGVSEVSKDKCIQLLADIEKRIHKSPNRTKYSMNTAMIAIGTYVPGLEKIAMKIANRIGQVEVDHGLTACQTSLAAPYIAKAAAHHRAKLAKLARRPKVATQAGKEKAAKAAKATKATETTKTGKTTKNPARRKRTAAR